MSWKASRDKERVNHPDKIISFCCQYVIPITSSVVLEGFTEHIRIDQWNNTKHIFRAHPSYQSTSGQANGVWYDWAIFELEKEMIPCQIMCFIIIDTLWTDRKQDVRGYEVDQNGLYAVVRRFKHAPKEFEGNNISFVRYGELEEGFYLLSCNSIYSEVCVVPDYSIEEINPCRDEYRISSNPKQFFVIGNQSLWLSSFKEIFKEVSLVGRENILSKGKAKYLNYIEKDSENQSFSW